MFFPHMVQRLVSVIPNSCLAILIDTQMAVPVEVFQGLEARTFDLNATRPADAALSDHAESAGAYRASLAPGSSTEPHGKSFL
jgi:hypothetical protein